jgi:hypothetical protein
MACARVNPPIPLSKIPIGLLAMLFNEKMVN